MEKTDGFSGGLLSLTGQVFTFVVPEGMFRVEYIKFYARTSKKFGETYEFNNLGVGHVLSSKENGTAMGDLPGEMSGTCSGGFLWLGVFKGDKGSILSKPDLKLGSDAVDAGNAIRALKKQLEGTPWAAEIDHPAENKPLKKGQVLEGKVDVVASAKAVAAIAAQTHDASAPPSDAGAVETAVGLYAVETVNGKPMPYLFPANKCTLLENTMDLKGDASYATTSTVECAGTKYPFPTSGFFGVQGGVLTFAVKVGPAVGKGTTMKIAGDTITIVAGPDTYVAKKK